jgi:hypothetical protein
MKEHELSLIYNTSKDSSNSFAIDRTRDMFAGGIDLFRLKGDPVNAFAFDRCGRDIAVMALMSRGIREIPL